MSPAGEQRQLSCRSGCRNTLWGREALSLNVASAGTVSARGNAARYVRSDCGRERIRDDSRIRISEMKEVNSRLLCLTTDDSHGLGISPKLDGVVRRSCHDWPFEARQAVGAETQGSDMARATGDHQDGVCHSSSG